LAVAVTRGPGRLSHSGRPGPKALLGMSALALVTLVVGLLVGAAFTDGAGRISAEVAVLVLAGFGGFLLFVLGIQRMEYFVLVLLVLRSSLDVSRLNADAQSQTISNPSSLVALMFLAVGLTWILCRRASGMRHPTSFLQRALIIFLVAAALCVIGSADPALSGLEFLRTSAAILMFFMVDRILEQTDAPQRVLAAVFGAAVIPVFLGLVGPAVGVSLVETKDRVERVTSTFVGANAFSYFLVFLSLMALGLALYAKPKLRWPLLGFAGILTLTLVLTYTRTAWIAFAAGVMVLGAFAGRKVLIAMVVVLVLSVLFVPAIGDRFQELGSDNTYNTYRRDSLEWRIAYWTDIIPLANANPVTGIGLKMTSEVADKLPHNDYLRSYVEMGLVGLAAFITVLVAMIRTPWKALKVATDPLQRGILLGFLSIGVALTVASLADNLINQVVVLWYVFALAGCASWAARRAAQTSLTDPTSSQPAVTPV
jgi:putative inorganic carbon (HCO3(-)) transporter